MKRITIYLALLLLLGSCGNKNPIYLKIGDLEISKYEYNRNLSRAFSTAKPSEQELAEWKKKYIDRLYIINEAYQLGLDSLQEVQKQLTYVSNLMMTQKYGYLWKKTMSPTVDTFKVVTDKKAQLRSKLFYFDYLCFFKPEAYFSIAGSDSIIESIEEYNQVKSVYAGSPEFETGYLTQQWPFLAFWEHREALNTLEPGEISQPIISDGKCFVFYLDYVEEISLSEDEKTNLRKELQLGMEYDLETRRDKNILEKSQPEFFRENIQSLALFLAPEKNSSEDFTNRVLVNFYMEEKK